ncbi:MAG: glycoside hydrolase family 2 TIM barrel-domain containing protein, partial [Lachnospira sp.]|nr:glycoside hydrolase family 2 TIM barrel-domain containing protein [Lachnospira sp.]
EWQFAKLPEVDIESIEHMDQMDTSGCMFEDVTIPHTWYQDGNAYEGAVIYKRSLELEIASNQNVFLQFQGADRWCRVYVDDTYVGEHKGGYAAFALDITEQCKGKKEHEITVLLDNRSFDVISPLAGDFTVFGGIYRDVNVIVTDQDCFDRTYYGTDGVIVCTDVDEAQNGVASVETHLLKKSDIPLYVRYICRDHQGDIVYNEIVEINQGKNIKKIVIQHPQLWNGMTNPHMYSFTVELMRNHEVIDHVEKLIGFKTVRLDAETGFYLNESHMKINGVAKHQDFGGVFNATTEKHQEKDMADLLEIGANSVRLSHYQHPQKMYDLCDETGMIVWAEIPFLKISKTEAFFENACQQLKELILQNMHHPSICFWGVQNEIAMFAEDETTYEQVRGLNNLVKELDSTRISASANLFCVKNDSELNFITDAVGYNIYFGWYYGEMKDNDDFIEKFHQENPQVPLGITEYGVDCNLKFHNTNPKVKDYSEEFQALYHETVYPIFSKKDYIWGTYVWNFYDFGSKIRNEGGVKYKNGKGLISYDRRTKKDAFYYYKSQWSDQPFVRIAESRYVNREVGAMDVKVYSNQKRVMLLANGIEVSCESDTGVFVFKNISIHHGQNVMKAHSGTSFDQVCFMGVSQPDSSYVFVDENPGLNVKNWFIDALEEEKMFPKGKLSIRESCLVLLENEEAMKVIDAFNENLGKSLRDRRGGLPLERVLTYMKNEVSEEDCKRLNAELIKIDK